MKVKYNLSIELNVEEDILENYSTITQEEIVRAIHKIAGEKQTQQPQPQTQPTPPNNGHKIEETLSNLMQMVKDMSSKLHMPMPVTTQTPALATSQIDIGNPFGDMFSEVAIPTVTKVEAPLEFDINAFNFK